MSDTPEIPAAIPKAETPAAGNALLGQLKRLRQGDSGMLPIIIGLVVLGGYFQFRSSTFLSANNLTDLFVQATIFILLGMAEIWLLLLGDIDLSVGWIMALGSAAAVILVDQQFHWPWYLAFALSIAITTLIGTIQGLLTIALKVPSFIVTLAGLFVWEGVAIFVIDRQGLGGTIPVHGGILYDLVNVNLSPVFTWIVLLAVAGAMGFLILNKDRSRRTSGLESLPFFVTLFKVIALIVGAIVLALIFNTNRGGGIFASQQGMPWAVPIVLFVLAAGSFILTRTKAGRYLYAIGGNTEAARRAGVRVNRYRLLAFALTGLTAGIAGLLYASQLGGISDGVAGGTLVLYAVAAAVIGGSSLYGGRGKMIHALVGGLVIATIYNGMALLQVSASVDLIATGLVLLAAIAVDSLARRGGTNAR